MSKKVQVLQVVGKLSCGGIQSWLMHVLRNLDRDVFQLDFLVQNNEPAYHEEEARDLGARIIRCPQPALYPRYCRNVRNVLGEYGPYNVVHSHVSYSGIILRLAHYAGVPVRIDHSHSDRQGLRSVGGLHRRVFLAATNPWIPKFATHGLAVSKNAAVARFGKNWNDDPRWQIYYCGINMEPFRLPVNPGSVRAELGLRDDAFVVGHVGRLAKVKNHAFLLKVAKAAVERDSRLHFLLVGDGPLKPAIENQIRKLGLERNVTLTGFRPDVARLMLGAMDAFLFPSHYEGLGLATIEAQCAGLPCLVANSMTDEVAQIPELVELISLSRPADHWASRIVELRRHPPTVTQTECLGQLEQGPFNIRIAIRNLEQFYLSHAVEPAAHCAATTI